MRQVRDERIEGKRVEKADIRQSVGEMREMREETGDGNSYSVCWILPECIFGILKSI